MSGNLFLNDLSVNLTVGGEEVSDSNPLPTTAELGDIAVSISGFAPNGNVANLSVTTSSDEVELPAGVAIIVTNKGANTAYIKLSEGAGSAATTDMALVAGAAVGLTVGDNTFLNAITASSTTSLNIVGGAGLVTGYGGGSSGGGGGGGEVTNAGTFAVQLTGATNNINNIAGTVSLPTGAATSAKQDTAQTSLSSIATNTGNINTALAGTLDVAIVSGGGSGGTASDFDDPIPAAGTAIGFENPDGDMVPGNVDANGNILVAGVGVAQGSTTSGQTLSPVGVRTLSATPTDTTAQTNMPVATVHGAQVVQPYALADSLVSGCISSAMTGTTSTSLVAAPCANLRNYITTIIVSNAHATQGTDILIQDGNGGTTLMVIPAAAVYGGAVITLPAPLRQPTANTALYCANVTTGASTKVSAFGFKAA